MNDAGQQEKGKQEMTSLDMRFLMKELRTALVGGVFRKIYQYGRAGSRQFLFEVFMPQMGGQWLYVDSNKLFLTRRKKAVPQEPPSFCMFLRKHLMNRKIKSVRQYEFDRIVEIATDENILVIELFSTGNVILCDSMYKIIMPLEFQKWRGREVKPKLPYKYPPKVTNPFELDFDSMRRGLSRSDKKLAGYLATLMGLGPEYAREVCARAGIQPEKPATDVSLEEASGLHQALLSLDGEKPRASVYSGLVSPFPLRILGQEKPKDFPSLSEALDEFFSEQQIESAREEAVKEATVEKERIGRIVEQQSEATGKWVRIARESKEMGDMIYSNYPTVQAALEGIMKARNAGMGWDEIKQGVAGEQTPEAETIKEIREGDGVVVLELGGVPVEIDMTRSVEENAARYYEDSKWAKKKMAGLGEASGEFRERLGEAEKGEEKALGEDFKRLVFAREKPAPAAPEKAAEGVEVPESGEAPEGGEAAPEPRAEAEETGEVKIAGDEEPVEAATRKPERKRWYERFRWFFSSDGFLVVAGRSADQNEMLLKKHTEPQDRVFHADIAGAAFVVIKTQGLEVPDVTKREAAEFSAANSKAWSRGLGTVDIFSVPRERVSKSPPSGEYLPKGSFMIHGEREWFRNLELKLAVGIRIDREAGLARVVSGPVMAVRKNSDYMVTLKPGFKKSLELARTIRNRILVKSRPEDRYLIEKLPLEELQVVVPSGMADIVEHAGEAV
jgi:predicted ribosome quality control (RQC) complex YloA/Tae2 family protein